MNVYVENFKIGVYDPMKKLICILSVTVMLLGLCACNQAATPQQTTEPAVVRNENMPKQLLRSDVTNVPLGTNDMTYEERRQLCMDFMELQVTFQWKPNVPFEFVTSNYKKGTPKPISPDEIYGGIFYHSKGFSNPYRWLEYYDETTGIMDMERAIAENGGLGEGAALYDTEYDANGNITYTKYRSMMTMGNQCSSSTCWSWGRVINSVAFGDTCDLNVSNGYIPVGCFSYSYEHEGKTYDMTTIREFGVESETNPLKYDTDDVIADWNKANGADAMYKCYAQLKPGDCLVNKGHTLMVKEVALYKNDDGTIDYPFSGVVVQEQVEAWASQKQEANGIMYKQQGRDNYAYTFEKLMKENYIPFTFAELLDPNDEQDKKHLDYYHSYADKLPGAKALYNTFAFTDEMHGDSVEKAVTYCTVTADSVSYADFAEMVVGSNYSISDAFVTVKDASGKELLKNIWRAPFSNFREVSMADNKCSWETDESGNLIPISDGVEALATGENTVEVTLQLSTGELLTAYKGTLTK